VEPTDHVLMQQQDGTLLLYMNESTQPTAAPAEDVALVWLRYLLIYRQKVIS